MLDFLSVFLPKYTLDVHCWTRPPLYNAMKENRMKENLLFFPKKHKIKRMNIKNIIQEKNRPNEFHNSSVSE